MSINLAELKLDPEKWAKVEQVEQLRVFHPRLNSGIRKIDDCRAMVGVSDEAPCLLIYGDAGAGKSTIFKEYRRRNSTVVVGSHRTRRPILSASIPSPATIASVIVRLLEELGDKFPDSGRTVREKYARLRNLIRDCQVEVILLDEFQHLLNSKNQKVLKDVADWFKSFVIETNVSVVLFGHSDCITVLDANGQFERRFSDYTVEPFSYGTGPECTEFKRLLKEIDKLLPFDEEIGLAEDDYSDRFFWATGGLMDKVMKLIRRGARNAIQMDKDFIEMKDFAVAFNEYHSYLSKGDRYNPFMVADFRLPKDRK